jgi:aspartyl-tRNA(Asn)/glutamyl-tRNA(Gln) amidotransferase subunit C
MFNNETIEQLSKLINVPIDLDEKEKLSEMLSQTIYYMDMLNEVDTTGVIPTYQVNNITNIYQDSSLDQTLTQKEVLQNAKNSKKGLFTTKGVFDR